MTVVQLLEKLEDIPQATMYRHLKQLNDANLIEVIETNKVRGTIEKNYAVKKENVKLSESDIEHTSVEEHLRYFMTYQANLLKEFEQYANKPQPVQYKEDGLGYWQATLHLTNDEMNQFGKELSEVVQKWTEVKASEKRQARTFATMFIPQK